ncbi:MAG: ice-binding family protein [Bacteroidota bacterium]|nr:ice-binding family protein [Bacteroidota bacterium]
MKKSKFLLSLTKLKTSIPIIALLSIILIVGCKKDKDNLNPPTVVSSDPSNNETAVVRNKAISVTFSEEMNPLLITSTTFNLMKGTTAVSGKVTYSGLIATFTPTNFLESSTVYTATITKAAKNNDGIGLKEDKIISFTTGGTGTGTGTGTGGGGTSTLSAVNLGSAGNYVILAKTAINNSPTSNITGDLGLSPAATSYITGLSLTNETGYATSAQVTGKIYAADMVTPTSENLTTAVTNMITAYNDAAGRPTPDFSELGAGNIGGKTLSAGLYKWTNTVTAPTNVTISGSSTDVWIFQIAGDLTVSSAVNITLSGGAQAKNIFWQVAGEVTIGTTAKFQGVILTQTAVTLGTGATLTGRALAQTAVILDSNVITNP